MSCPLEIWKADFKTPRLSAQYLEFRGRIPPVCVFFFNKQNSTHCDPHLVRALLLPSPVRLSVTLCTGARQAPLSMGFSKQEYSSGFPFPPPGALTRLGTEPASPAFQAGSLPRTPPEESFKCFPVSLSLWEGLCSAQSSQQSMWRGLLLSYSTYGVAGLSPG